MYLAHKRVYADAPKEGEGRTKQSFVKECNINNIMGRWKKTGVLEHLAKHPPMYGDFSQAIDYASAQQLVIDAQARFDALPAHVRLRMDHDPQTFVEFMQDPENHDEAIELGLVNPKKGPKAPETVPEEAGAGADPTPGAQPPAGETPPLDSRGNTPIAGGE